MNRLTVDDKTLSLHTRQLFDALTQFKSLLENEATLLKQFNVEDLPTLLEQKSSLSETIEQHFKQLNTGLGAQTPKRLDDWLQDEIFSNLSTPLQKTFTDLIQLTNECHDLNQANGMTVQTLNNLNQAALDILTGQTAPSSQIYGASGERQKSKKQTTLGKA